MTDVATVTDMTTAIAAPVPEAEPGRRRSRRRRRPLLILAAAWLSVVGLAAILADLLPLNDPNIDAGRGTRTAPGHFLSEFLGTDEFGRSELSRLVYGARVSLAAGLGSVLIAFGLGLIVGVASGYFRGKLDGVSGLLIDSILAFPGLIILMGLAATLQPGIKTVVIGLSIIAFPAFARLARANTLRFTSAEFILASRGLGAKTRTILFRELLPNVASTLIAYAGVVMAALILAEASLSFLGLGVVAPTASWGGMIASGRTYLQPSPHLVFVPSAVLFLTIYSLNLVAEWYRSRYDAVSKV